MAKVRAKARILELTTTAGNGPYALAGAADGSYNRFSSIMAIGDVVKATVVEPGVAFWTGLVTYSAANQITLTTVEETKGTFGAGTKEIFAGPLASGSLFADDISGAIVTGGISTSYTVASYRVYDTLARLDGAVIAFTPHATSGAAPTLSVDGLTAKPVRAVPGVDLLAGILILGTPYMAVYNNADGAFYLHGMFGNPYGIPIGGGLDYWGASAPNSAFALAQGQAISRTAFPAAFALFGTTFGAGNGTTTFNIPDKVGRVSAMLDAGSSRISSGYFGGNPANLGAVGGAESLALAAGQLPTLTSVNAAQAINVASAANVIQNGVIISYVNAGGGGTFVLNASPTNSPLNSSGNNSISVASQGTGGAGAGAASPHRTVQPTIVCNYIIRVL